MEGAQSRLRLFQIDLLNYDSIVRAVTGAAGVFHLASPCIVDRVDDPERQLLDPAIKGTINVLTAAKELGVRRVVVTGVDKTGSVEKCGEMGTKQSALICGTAVFWSLTGIFFGHLLHYLWLYSLD